MTAPAPTRWAMYPRRNPAARLRLFCFPYAGGGATTYFAWPPALPPEVEVVAVQPPGREGRLTEPPYSDMARLVEVMHRELRPHLDRPFAFFGHSNGGLMAFELARSLRRQGEPMPLHLFASGRPAPQLPPRDPAIHALPYDEFVHELRRFAGTPEEILQNAEIMELVTPVLRADFALGETYRYDPEPPLELPISAYGGERDPEVSRAQVEAWREQTAAEFRMRMFPGDHFFINADRSTLLAEVSRELRALLAAHVPARAHGV